MINLKEETAFAHGNHRGVYRHPEKEGRCLKLMVEPWKESPRWKRANILGKIFRPRGYFDENEGEYQFSKKLSRRAGSVAWSFIARAHGYVESDLGQVLEVDLITDADGQISSTLKEYVWTHGMTPQCEEAIEVFWKQLDEHWVLVQARPDNLSIKVKEDGSLQIFAIDGYAFGPFIPLVKWIRSKHKRKLAHLRKNQVGEMENILSKRESGNKDAIGTQGIKQ